MVVPACPRAPPPREKRAIGVEHGLVALIGDRFEQLALAFTGVGEQGESLIGVGGDHHRVEALLLTSASRDDDMVGMPSDARHRCREPETLLPGTRECLDIS